MALEIASRQGGVIVNADALQVFSNWNILTARPSKADERQATHLLYGHVAYDEAYSVGHWLRDISKILSGPERPIIVGGTGLYFTALTVGLADIPPTPENIRADADALIANGGINAMIEELDSSTRGRIDLHNPVRVQRAWEVQRATGRGLASWQDETPAPILPLTSAQPVLLNANRDWLSNRIELRFDRMIRSGALEEVAANMPCWYPALPSSKAIGAAELIDHLRGNRDLNDAVEAGKTATRQYAKRQRTWFRSKMSEWRSILLPE